jgi:hypothetical protein
MTILSHKAPQITEWRDLPQRTLELLKQENINSSEQWLAAGRRRKTIFGVTRAVVAQLDALARAAR